MLAIRNKPAVAKRPLDRGSPVSRTNAVNIGSALSRRAERLPNSCDAFEE
ncbi:hypothetical protein PENARI_c004G03536 [Penicillium arizonense]|uniref:Uncharacterized protein n=1 Tax=Penicillium arizonense TaxID=1835702 RepID=A0A1F5LQ07_PENAI|nr:hypothetical protein PENARI_c004G03536 [Penicillium arizonense]OGE55302.1 hypothetical protein PENARI_c004G03536 [Penicillium arizonense]